ncbi:MAG TPA: cation diffusion facilitator family transporter [Gaiellaceae bacterium]|nr:cation diffusion facilitator family transporter [Gaiellaceae bacterium]
MEAQRRTALWSVIAAVALIALKLGTGLAAHSLGLVSAAADSGTDLIAALLTFFAVGVAVRPADPGHQYGHGKAEHLAALAEGAILVVASIFIVWRAISHLVHGGASVQATWYAFVVVGIVICIDVARTMASWRGARAYSSPALASNALHFGSDLGGSVAVLIGLLLVRAGHPDADAVAALFVAALVLLAASRLMRRNIDVLMDLAPADAEEAARRAIVGVRPAVQLRRLRMRQAAGRVFADVVIGVDYGAAVGQGHAAADAVERAVQAALPEADVVVHVEPVRAADADMRERAHAAALNVPRVREVHNVSVVSVDSGTELSLHLKLPGELSLEEAHAIAEEVERAIERAVPEVSSVRTHLEPLGEEAAGTEVAGDAATVRRIVRTELGVDPADLRFVDTDEGLVAYLTLRLGSNTLADAHADASRVEELIRRERPEIADVVVHTEPR